MPTFFLHFDGELAPLKFRMVVSDDHFSDVVRILLGEDPDDKTYNVLLDWFEEHPREFFRLVVINNENICFVDVQYAGRSLRPGLSKNRAIRRIKAALRNRHRKMSVRPVGFSPSFVWGGKYGEKIPDFA